MSEDPYEILGVSNSTPLEEIKVAYRLLAKKHHPDKGGDKDKILAINAAWELLKKQHKTLSLNTINTSKAHSEKEYKKEDNIKNIVFRY